MKRGGRADEKIALLGAMQSLFEGSMYTFVFLWTPALSPKGERLPHGMIFACFMVASMAGAPTCLSACEMLLHELFLALNDGLLMSGPGVRCAACYVTMFVIDRASGGLLPRPACYPKSNSLNHGRVGAGGAAAGQHGTVPRGALHAGRVCAGRGRALRARALPHQQRGGGAGRRCVARCAQPRRPAESCLCCGSSILRACSSASAPPCWLDCAWVTDHWAPWLTRPLLPCEFASHSQP